MKYLVASFHNGNLPAALLEAQREVFSFHRIPLMQWNSKLPHGEMMDECLGAHDWDVAALFDIDAFCTDGAWLWDCMTRLAETAGPEPSQHEIHRPLGVIGGAHNANHRRGAMNYASPACCVISRNAYNFARANGCAGFRTMDPKDGTAFKDSGEDLSDKLRELGYRVGIVYPKTVRVPKWTLHGCAVKFGNGTDYGRFYHEFESRDKEGNASEQFALRVREELTRSVHPMPWPPSGTPWVQS